MIELTLPLLPATSRFATGPAMAHSNSYRFALVLVGPITTDTASFDHIGGLLFCGFES